MHPKRLLPTALAALIAAAPVAVEASDNPFRAFGQAMRQMVRDFAQATRGSARGWERDLATRNAACWRGRDDDDDDDDDDDGRGGWGSGRDDDGDDDDDDDDDGDDD